MNLKLSLVIIGLTWVLSVYSQTFNKRYGASHSDWGAAIAPTNDGGFVVTGQTYSNGADGNMFLMKLNRDGVLQWQKDIFGVNRDAASSIIQLNNGDIIIGGYTGSYGSGCWDALLVAFDSVGNSKWAKAYGDVSCREPDNFSLTTDGIIGCGENGWLFKVNREGDLLWSKVYSNVNETFTAVKQTKDLGFLAVGGPSGSISMLRTDSIGNPLWFKKYPLPGNTRTYDIELLEGGFAVLTGMIYQNAYGNIADIFLLKIDTAGNTVWFKQYGFTWEEYGRSVKATLDNGFIIGGYTNSFGHGDWDACLLKTDENGDLEWAKTYGDIWWDQAYEVQPLNDGGYVFVGNSVNGSVGSWADDSSYVYVVRTDSNGATTCRYMDWTPLQKSQTYTANIVGTSASNFGVDSTANVTTSDFLFTERDFCASGTQVCNSSIDVSTTTDGVTIIANNTEPATYQWINCNDNSPIPFFSTSRGYVASENGSYAVIITTGTCVDTSDCVSITTVGISQLPNQYSFSVYPNPTSDFISISSLAVNAEFQLSDLTGKNLLARTFLRETTIDLTSFKEGIYFLRVGTETKKIVKL